MAETVDVAVIGAGPSGIAAALSLRKAGIARLIVIDREGEAGGVPRHCGHPPFGLAEFSRLMTGPAYARRLASEAAAAGIDVRTRTTVRRLGGDGELALTDPARGEWTLEARRVLLATGARETPRAARRVSGGRPLGILTTGALQSFIYLHRRVPFRRPVVIGTELVSFSALLTCRRAGIRPLAMIEENGSPTASSLCAAYARWHGIAMRYRTRLAEICGGERVEAVIVENASGAREAIACDGVLFTGQFVPAAELVRASPLDLDPATGGPAVDQHGRLSDPAYFAAGNLLRAVETSAWCYREGREAGRLIAEDLRGGLAGGERSIAIERGAGLKYVMPQRIAGGANGYGHRALQLRVDRPVRGRLVVEADDRTVWSRPITLKPERRFLLPLEVITPHRSASRLRLSIRERSN
jgi:NADPH-dependent 2,4-dienoyl-CoA reductase/sulfur reductase-like enzyme